MIDWVQFVDRLGCLPGTRHKLKPACSSERIHEAGARLGLLPEETRRMLLIFNGAELFVDAMPQFTLFGLSEIIQDCRKSTWFIDCYTPKWRLMMNRPLDFVIGITCYDGVFVVRDCKRICEWNNGEERWLSEDQSYEEWVEGLIKDGMNTAKELKGGIAGAR